MDVGNLEVVWKNETSRLPQDPVLTHSQGSTYLTKGSIHIKVPPTLLNPFHDYEET